MMSSAALQAQQDREVKKAYEKYIYNEAEHDRVFNQLLMPHLRLKPDDNVSVKMDLMLHLDTVKFNKAIECFIFMNQAIREDLKVYRRLAKLSAHYYVKYCNLRSRYQIN